MDRILFRYLLNFVALSMAISLSSGIVYAQIERNKAIDHYQSAEYLEAIKLLEELDKHGKLDYHSALYLGGAYLKSGVKDKAVLVFKNLPDSKSGTAFKYDTDLKIKKRPTPQFSRYASENETTGFIRLAIEFRSDGTIGFVLPFQGTSANYIKPAVEAAQGIKFRPAVLNGRQVTVVRIFEFERIL